MKTEEIRNLSVEEITILFKWFLDSKRNIDWDEKTCNTRLNDAFYIARNNEDFDFIGLIISEYFETEARTILTETLKAHSKAKNYKTNVSSYMSHLRTLRNFLLEYDGIKMPDTSRNITKPYRTEKKVALKANISADEIIYNIKKYHSSMNADYTRYNSWILCFNAFKDNRHNPEKEEYLCLHLACFLASWGMLRNSALMNYDYLVHKQLVKEIRNSKYDKLYSQDELDIDLVFELSDKIKECYPKSFSNSNSGKPSDTFITKIIMGIFGCVPAYTHFAVMIFRLPFSHYFSSFLGSVGCGNTVCSLCQIISGNIFSTNKKCGIILLSGDLRRKRSI